jgi:hypothetical protein
MKKFTFVIILVVTALLASGVIAANENDVFLPIVYGGPTLPPPSETPTPTPEYVDGYNWVFVGVAFKQDEFTVIWGHKPGYCYDLKHNKVEKTIYLEAVKIPVSECDRESYNPEAPWPPPEFPPPPSLPPEFDYGHIYKLVLDVNAKVVCSVYFPANCVNVR